MSVYDEVLQLKEDFEKRAKKIQVDKNLSDIGRRDALRKLADEKDAAMLRFVPRLRSSVVEVGAKIDRLRGARSALDELEREKLDYNRLAFETSELRNSLAGIKKDVTAVREKFDSVLKGGDTYRLRAFLTLGEEIIPQDGGSWSREWQELKGEMNASELKIHTGEYRKYHAEEMGLLENLKGLETDSSILAQNLTSSYQAGTVVKSIFEGLSRDRTGELEIHFGNTSQDKDAAETEKRLNAERESLITSQREFCARFGMEYDPLIHGLPEVDPSEVG